MHKNPVSSFNYRSGKLSRIHNKSLPQLLVSTYEERPALFVVIGGL